MTRFGIVALTLLFCSAGPARAVYVSPAFPNLTSFNAPIGVEDPLDGTDRLFVVERAGMIYVFENDPSVTTRSLFLDIADSVTTVTEGGLLSLTFHPQYESNRYFYVVYTNEGPRRTILSRFTADAGNPDVAVPTSELRILEIPQVNLHHKGGRVHFGPDGYLYLSLGDDGSSDRAQNLARIEGKVLRIDVDHPAGGKNYGIPPDNPFAGNPNGWFEEIWAFGFRNPWRFGFDPSTGKLWLGDVGQNAWEEIDAVKKGRNYGWPRMEASSCLWPPVCDTTGLDIDLPVFAYDHSETGSASITGGYVYRGSSVPSLVGKYVYSDFINGHIWALDATSLVNMEIAQPSPGSISSFGVDKDQELFFTSFDGKVYRFFESVTAVQTPILTPGALIAVLPNPFRTSVTIEYSLAARSHATLEIFDVRGRLVTTLVDGAVGEGGQVARWDGRDPGGNARASGVYFLRLSANGAPLETRRIVLLR
jgi:glucose/arabinose dehydrogenase